MPREVKKTATGGLDRRGVLLGAAALGASALWGCQRAEVRKDAPTRGFSKAGLAHLHTLMASHVERGNLPGLVTLLGRGDEVHVDAVGTHALGGGTPMRRDTLFRIASMTKPLSGALTLMLVEEGKLRLDEPVDRLLPELANRRVLKRPDSPLDDTVPARRPILVSDLLTLRMGLGALFTQGDLPIVRAMNENGTGVGPLGPQAPNADAWLKALGSLPLIHQPGEVWMYDTGLSTLGVLLERASGQSLEALFRERLLLPLGMHDTGFIVPAEKLDRLPPCYFRNPETGTFQVFDDAGPASRFSRPPGFASASSGLVSTADDYLAFARMMLHKGQHQGQRLLSERSVELMTTDHLTPEQKAASPFTPGFWDKHGWGYALSVIHQHAPGDPRGFGWDGGYGTSCYWDPETGLIGILLTQRMMDSPSAPPAFVDFWRASYEALTA